MARLKNHPVFTITISLLLAVAAGAGVLLYFNLGKVAKAERAVQQKSRELSSYTQRSPYPSQANADAIKAELAKSEELVGTMQAALKGRGKFAERVQSAVPPAGTTEAYFDLANFVEAMRSAAEADKITIPAGTRFGFATYASTGPDTDLIPQVHRQRLIAEYLLKTLFKAGPQELVSLQRTRPVVPGETQNATNQNNVSSGNSSSKSPDNDFFTIDPRMTAAVPGFVESTGFKVTFIGYSAALRDFLNKIASFNMPLVVRSVEVEPAKVDKNKTSSSSASSSGASSLSALFGTPTGSSATTPAPEVAKPIVEQSRSKFTVTIEYINLVATSADTQTNS